MSNYFVIHCSEDGDIGVEGMDKDTLLERINEKYWGPYGFLSDIPTEGRDLLTQMTNPMYWGTDLLIIKGEIVTPEAKEKVIEYEIT